jgi:UDP-N-acetylmuramoyl-tripeptide--D-alanyl-D-alanine ligase
MSFRWTDLEVRRALGMNPERARPGVEFTGVGSDSRKVEPGQLLVALRGERFDGHDFVPDALARGAAGVVVSREVAVEESTLLYPVADTLTALGALARHRRLALKARVVGITGSSGKTTAKELLREALTGSYRVHATAGNLNNRVGLPQTLLAAPSDAQVLVLELGTNEPGEIGILTGIAAPDTGVITTVSETHLEGVAVVGDEPGALAKRARALLGGRKLLVAGLGAGADPELRAYHARADELGRYRFRWMGEAVELQLPGRHSVRNALLALAVAHALGVPPREAARRVRRARPWGMRSELRTLGGLTLLVDCYNANPQSVRAALDLLVATQRLGPRVAVLGSMLELGERTQLLHREALEDALARPLDLVLATGLFAEAARWVELPVGGPELLAAPSLEEAGDLLMQRLGGTEVVLLKASRGVAMERLVPRLEERFGPGAPALGVEEEGKGPGGGSRISAGKEG